MKTIFRPELESHFTCLPNALFRDKTISFKARGVLTMILTHTEEWEVHRGWLIEQGTEGREAIQTAMHELESAGYAVFSQSQMQEGGFTRSVWTFHGSPVPISARSRKTFQKRKRHTADRIAARRNAANRTTKNHCLKGKMKERTTSSDEDGPPFSDSEQLIVDVYHRVCCDVPGGLGFLRVTKRSPELARLFEKFGDPDEDTLEQIFSDARRYRAEGSADRTLVGILATSF